MRNRGIRRKRDKRCAFEPVPQHVVSRVMPPDGAQPAVDALPPRAPAHLTRLSTA